MTRVIESERLPEQVRESIANDLIITSSERRRGSELLEVCCCSVSSLFTYGSTPPKNYLVSCHLAGVASLRKETIRVMQNKGAATSITKNDL